MLDNCGFLYEGRPLWREDGSAIYSYNCLWALLRSRSRAQVTLRSKSHRTHDHILLSHLRLLGSLFVTSERLAGLRWRYSNRVLLPVEVQVTLRPTVSRPVRHGVLPLLEQVTRCYIYLSDNYFLYFSCRRPLWREDRSVICSAMTQFQFQVTMRPTVCRPVRLMPGPITF
jgi:hypothetical protein